MFSELLFCENEPSPVVSLWTCACFARSATDLLLVGNWKPGPQTPSSWVSLGPPHNYDRGGCDRKHQASPLLLWLWQKFGFSLSPPRNHSPDNIVQLKPAGVLSCNPIELQQKAWLATTLLLSDSPIHCFPPFFRPSSSLARNMDKEICALHIFWFITYFLIFLLDDLNGPNG